jgi:hypothetical protein
MFVVPFVMYGAQTSTKNTPGFSTVNAPVVMHVLPVALEVAVMLASVAIWADATENVSPSIPLKRTVITASP